MPHYSTFPCLISKIKSSLLIILKQKRLSQMNSAETPSDKVIQSSTPEFHTPSQLYKYYNFLGDDQSSSLPKNDTESSQCRDDHAGYRDLGSVAALKAGHDFSGFGMKGMRHNTEPSKERPTLPYAQLITHAIESSPNRRITLNGIYNYVMTNYPYFQTAGSGWKNSVRHNLSLNKSFQRVPRPPLEKGKGAYWTVAVDTDENKRHVSRRNYGSQKTPYPQPMDSNYGYPVNVNYPKPNEMNFVAQNLINNQFMSSHRFPSSKPSEFMSMNSSNNLMSFQSDKTYALEHHQHQSLGFEHTPNVMNTNLNYFGNNSSSHGVEQYINADFLEDQPLSGQSQASQFFEQNPANHSFFQQNQGVLQPHSSRQQFSDAELSQNSFMTINYNEDSGQAGGASGFVEQPFYQSRKNSDHSNDQQEDVAFTWFDRMGESNASFGSLGNDGSQLWQEPTQAVEWEGLGQNL